MTQGPRIVRGFKPIGSDHNLGTNKIVVKKISYEDKCVLRNLMELYLYDLSEFTGEDVNKHGFYQYKYIDHYWKDTKRHPFFIFIDEKIAGFFLVIESEPSKPNELAEFFIMRKYRRTGLGKKVAFNIFDMFKGTWKVMHYKCNKTAEAFWEKVIQQYTYDSFNEIKDSNWPDYRIFTFKSR